MAVAHGGQVLLTDEARAAVGAAAEVRDLGYHRLKDLRAPEHLFQLLAAGLEQEFPVLRSLNRSNLPTPANPLMGRGLEVRGALERLARREVRLLTLVGVGGAGKTRLAIEVAAEAAGRYGDGVWIVPLAPIGDRRLMVSEIARVLEVPGGRASRLSRPWRRRLAERELLLVLDNFEHLIDAAGVVAELLASAPRLDVLATSREPLRIVGEHRMDVPPLALEDASELFLARARAVRPDLDVDRESVAAIERMCVRLDGLPLALELAAAWIVVFGPRALEARLAEGLPLPAGPRDLPERQRTLRATIDWSYRLLTAGERELFASLAPFIGGVRVDATELVWGRNAIEGLTSLAQKSLLRRREDPDGEPRFWMLETIRDYALDRADATAPEAADRHAQHFEALTQQAWPNLVGPHQRRWLDRLEADHRNLRAALERLVETAPARAVRMAAILAWFWEMRGYEEEAHRRLTEVLARAPADSPYRGEALFSAGWVAESRGDAQAAEPLLLEALPLLTEQGEHRLIALALSHLGTVAEMLGDHETAIARHEQAIAAATAAGDDWALGVALNDYAIVNHLRDDIQRTRSILLQAFPVIHRTGDAFKIAMVAGNLAEIALDAGELEYAGAMNDESLEQAHEIEFRPLIANALVLGAIISLEEGDPERALSRVRDAVDIGSLYQTESRALMLTATGALAAIQGDPEFAARLWGAADHARARIGLAEPPTPARLRARWQPHAQSALADEATWDAAWAAGRDLSLKRRARPSRLGGPEGSISRSAGGTGFQPHLTRGCAVALVSGPARGPGVAETRSPSDLPTRTTGRT